MLSFLLFHGTALTALALITIQDWKTHKFNAVIPVSALLILAFLSNPESSGLGIPFLTLTMASAYGILNDYIRPGDILPIGLYSIAFNSFQSIFTLVTVTGLYLYTFPMIRGEKEWIPYLPALLISYLAQLLLF